MKLDNCAYRLRALQGTLHQIVEVLRSSKMFASNFLRCKKCNRDFLTIAALRRQNVV